MHHMRSADVEAWLREYGIDPIQVVTMVIEFDLGGGSIVWPRLVVDCRDVEEAGSWAKFTTKRFYVPIRSLPAFEPDFEPSQASV